VHFLCDVIYKDDGAGGAGFKEAKPRLTSFVSGSALGLFGLKRNAKTFATSQFAQALGE
jgi:hypothetical protein